MLAALLADDPLDEPEGARVAEVAPHVGRGRGRYDQNRGFIRDASARTKMKLGWARHEIRRLRGVLNKGPSFAQTVVQNVFGLSSVDHGDIMRRKYPVLIKCAGDACLTMDVDRRKQHAAHIDRGLVSHIRAQALGVVDWLRATKPMVTIVASIFDDADMWIQRPKNWFPRGRDSNAAASNPALVKKLEKRGRNVHMPVLNASETLVSVPFPHEQAPWRSMELAQPAVPMPAANYATVFDRWRKWTVLNGLPRAGRAIDPDNVIAPAMGAAGDKILLLCKDALGVNSCIEGLVASAAISSRGDDHEFTLFTCNCCAHSAVLCMRPIMERIPEVCATMVRMGHLFESSRFFCNFMKVVDALVPECRFRLVRELPPNAAVWRSRAQQILTLTRGALDLSEDDELFVLMMFNGPWELEEVVHFHTHDCPCGGQDTFWDNCKKALHLLLGGGSPGCLLYRWKNFEKASSYTFRGLATHGLLRRAICGMYDQPGVFENAQREAARAAQHGDVNHGANQTVRAGKVVRYLRDPNSERRLHQALILNAPQQHFLNKCFSAEAASRACIAEAGIVPAKPGAGAAATRAFQDKLDKARKQNLDILNRTTAQQVQVDLSALLWDLNGAKWALGLWDSRAAKFEAASLVACAVTNVWKRLDFNMSQPRFRVLAACAGDFDEAQLDATLTPLREKSLACGNCVDQAFSGYWLRRLLVGSNRRRAHSSLKAALAVVPLSSALIERKHPLGQEIRAGKRRGRAPTAYALSGRTYRKIVQLDAQRKRLVAVKSVVGDMGCKRAVGAFTRQLMSASLLGRDHRLQKRKKLCATPQFIKSTGFSIYIRSLWGSAVRPGTPGFAEEQRRVSAAWRALAPAQRQIYNARAAQQHQVREHALARHGDAEVARTWAQRRGRKRKAFGQLREVIDHSVWKSGTALSALGVGLRHDKLDVDMTNASAQALSSQIFGYDETIVSNPPSTAGPEIT